jgi:hypothetical protein
MTTPFKLKYKNSAFPFKKDGVPRKEIVGAPFSEMWVEKEVQSEMKATYESDPKKYAYLKDYIGHDAGTRGSLSKISQKRRKKEILEYQKSQLKL